MHVRDRGAHPYLKRIMIMTMEHPSQVLLTEFFRLHRDSLYLVQSKRLRHAPANAVDMGVYRENLAKFSDLVTCGRLLLRSRDLGFTVAQCDRLLPRQAGSSLGLSATLG